MIQVFHASQNESIQYVPLGSGGMGGCSVELLPQNQRRGCE